MDDNDRPRVALNSVIDYSTLGDSSIAESCCWTNIRVASHLNVELNLLGRCYSIKSPDRITH